MVSFFEEIRAERAALIEYVRGLDPAALDRPGAVGRWSVKDALAHLAGWQEWMLKALPARLEHGELPEGLRVTESNVDDWNRQFVEERRSANTDNVLDDLSTGMRRLMFFAVNLGLTRLEAPNPWPERPASLAEYLREQLAGHDREHREQIAREVRQREGERQ